MKPNLAKPGDGPTLRARRRRTSAHSHWLTPLVLGIGLASLFCDLGHEMVTALLPAYLASIGAAAGALGTVEGCADGLSSLAKLYGGWLADRVRRRKPLIVSGYAVMAVSPLVIGAALSWPLVAVGRSLGWVSRGLRSPAKKALLAESVPERAYGRVFGLERAMDTAGAVAAPLAVLALLAWGASARGLILLSAFPALLAVAAVLVFVRETTPVRPRLRRPFLRSFSGFSAEFKRFLTAVGLFGLGDFADTFFILYAVSVLTPLRGASKAAAWSVGLYALHNAVSALCAYGSGGLADRFPKRLLLVLGYALASAAAAMAALGAASLPGLALMFLLAGAGVGLYEAVENALAAELLPAGRRGAGFGAHATVTGVGDWVSSLSVGWVWAVFGSAVAFGGACALMVAGTVFMALSYTPLKRALDEL